MISPESRFLEWISQVAKQQGIKDESQNLYVAKSRRNSLFFITDEGARRGAMFYSLTLSCMLNGVDAFEYFTDVIDKLAQMNPKSPIEKYRDLLPDKWTKQN